MSPAISALLRKIDAFEPRRFEGRVVALNGFALDVTGPPKAMALGAVGLIESSPRPVRGEIVGFRDGRAIMLPFDPLGAVRPGARVRFQDVDEAIYPCAAWLGRVVDAFGAPIDSKGPLRSGPVAHRVCQAALPAHARARVGARIETGVRVIDMFTALCRGQRIGIFAGSGVGKSVLMSMLARGADADVIVIGLIGERGREVKEFLEDTLGEEGLARSVTIVATSDEPAACRRRAAQTACAVAEHFRDEGKHVLLLLDSVTRFAMAGREIGLAAGEPPTTKGYTPSVFADLPRLLERAGPGRNKHAGCITGVFTVLVDGDDHDEPIADAVRGILDGHIVMERAVAERGRYPAINVLRSVSRMMPGCHAPPENALVRRAKELLGAYSDMEELIRIGAYKTGSDATIDEAIARRPALEALLNQAKDDRTPIHDSFERLSEALQ